MCLHFQLKLIMNWNDVARTHTHTHNILTPLSFLQLGFSPVAFFFFSSVSEEVVVGFKFNYLKKLLTPTLGFNANTDYRYGSEYLVW